MNKVLFIDRDGTLITEPPDEQVDSLEKIALVPDVVASLLQLREFGYRFVMVTNQDGLGTKSFPARDFEKCQAFVLALFASQGIEFDEVFVCPHVAADNCNCRKPRTGLLTRYLASTQIDLAVSAVIGDRQTDAQLAEALGVRSFLVGNDPGCITWREICGSLTPGARTAEYARKTRETDIAVTVNLDASAPVRICTGIGFFDHMLEQIANHGAFSLQVQCDGDLAVDEHHTVEDVAIAMGTALRTALGTKRGVGRFGFLLPMDESEARVSLDLSGRPYLVFNGEFPRERVGELPTELVGHFFHSLADSLGATLHMTVAGDNSHHMVEACFKAMGRVLRQAIKVQGNELPSTKGMLA